MASLAPDDPSRILDRLDSDRRQFLKKVLLSAYVAPFVASFGMKGLGLGEAVAQSNLCPSSNVTVPNTSADLVITKTATPSTVTAGSNITYTIRVENCGPATAVNVSFSDPLPANTTIVSVSQTSGPAFVLNIPPAHSGGTVSGNRTTLNVGEVAVFQIVVHVNP
jgi:uncharacterized repeat protein (TIGR01451 family)